MSCAGKVTAPWDRTASDMGAVLLDTTVLLDELRGIAEAVPYIKSLPEQPLISMVTVVELYAGVHPGEELELVTHNLRHFQMLDHLTKPY